MVNVRTCVGCRQQGIRANLVRIVFSDGNLQIDLTKSLPGRGSWLHATQQCFELAIQRGSFARAHRVRVTLQNLAILKEQAEKMFEN